MLTMLKGLPASGKSTWAREFLEFVDFTGVAVVSKDEIRKTNPTFKEKDTVAMEDTLIREYLNRKLNVIVDDTNLNPFHEKRLRKIAEEFKTDFEIKEFDTPVNECITRDMARPNSVGEEVIRGMFNKYYKDNGTLGIASTPVFGKEKQFGELDNNNFWQPVAVFDMDGTLALMGERSPFDYSKVMEDEPNWPVVQIMRALKNTGYGIVILSGREDVCMESTVTWLEERIGLTPADYKIFMRKAKDFRKDNIVKYEIMKNEVLPSNFVVGVFDDRDQVVKMWREAGLQCYQVAEGKF